MLGRAKLAVGGFDHPRRSRDDDALSQKQGLESMTPMPTYVIILYSFTYEQSTPRS